jgi:hypothetical protein
MLSANDFLHAGSDAVPFGICSGAAAAIAALRQLADGMETGKVVMHQAQTGCTAQENEMQKHVVFLEFSVRPW